MMCADSCIKQGGSYFELSRMNKILSLFWLFPVLKSSLRAD